MNQPVRRKTDADATAANQLDVTGIFCGKLFYCPANNRNRCGRSIESRTDPGFSSLSSVAGCRTARSLRNANSSGLARRPISLRGSARSGGQNERPVRGDNRTGQAIRALGVDGRSRRIQPRWGGITAPTDIVSREGRRTFKGSANFFNLFAKPFQVRESLRAGPTGRFVGRHRSPRLVQGPGHGNILTIPDFFRRRGVRNRGERRRRRSNDG